MIHSGPLIILLFLKSLFHILSSGAINRQAEVIVSAEVIGTDAVGVAHQACPLQDCYLIVF